MGPLERE